MRYYSIFVFLFIFQISFGQKFYNKFEINFETFPEELQELKNWLKSKTDTLFYSGFFYETSNQFSIIGRKEKFNWYLPGEELNIVMKAEQISSGLLHKSPALRIYFESNSKQISRYHQNFNYKRLADLAYYYDYAIDFLGFSEEELFDSIIRDYTLELFLQKINEKYQTDFTLEDLSKYSYCESEEAYLNRLKYASGDYVEGRCQRNEYQQFSELIYNSSIANSVSKMAYEFFVKNADEKVEKENLSDFLKNLYGNVDYTSAIRNSLIQKIVFYDFPAKIFYSKNLSEFFQIHQAEFSLIPTENSFYFESKFKGINKGNLRYDTFQIVFYETYFESFLCENENCNDKHLVTRGSY